MAVETSYPGVYVEEISSGAPSAEIVRWARDPGDAGATPDKSVGEGTPFAKPPLVVAFPKRQARRGRLSP
jgi:hypothetical protein